MNDFALNKRHLLGKIIFEQAFDSVLDHDNKVDQMRFYAGILGEHKQVF